MWWCSREPESPCVDWSAIQTLFGTARSDVLILLDCCAAASSAAGMGTGTMEAIAACGWETRAPPPGQYSFTNTLIEVLEEWACKPSFSAAMLHTEVLFVLKQKRPERGRDGRGYCWESDCFPKVIDSLGARITLVLGLGASLSRHFPKNITEH